ncbi:MAG: glycosyltransferase [Lachnospiraceae bacterium]|nr:glycosyltransferase [Lachnospiraceae bacterium]
MRILVISPKNKTVFNFRGDLIRDMIEKGNEVYVTGPNRDFIEDIMALGVKEFIEIPLVKDNMSVLGDLAYLKKLREIMKCIQPELVFGYTIKPVIYGTIGARSCGIKEIYPMITGLGRVYASENLKIKLVRRITKILYRIALKGASKVIFQNPDDMQEFVKEGCLPADKAVTVNGSGVNMKRFCRSEIPEKPVFLMVSRMIREKGVLDFARAARAVKKKVPEARFIILGGYDNSIGGLREKDLKEYIEDGSIELPGEVKDPVSFYGQSSVFVLPSYYREGLPRTILEGMSCGRPVITTDWPGCREPVKDGVNGYLVPVKNPKELAKKMYQLAVDRKKVLAMSEESYKICREKYDVEIINGQMRNIMGYERSLDMRDTRVESLKNMLDVRLDLRDYLFRRGFLLTNRDNILENEFPFYGNWKKTKLGSMYAYTHPKTNLSYYEKKDKIYFLFGHAYNPFTMESNETKELEYIGQKEEQGCMQDAIDELTGVFVFGCIFKDRVRFQVDPSGMQSAYYGAFNGQLYLTSHPQIVGDICGLEMTEIARELIHYKWYGRVMGCYLPADLSVFDEIKRIVPNIEYKFKDNQVRHRRFYPLKEIQVCRTKAEYEEVVEQAADILKSNMILATEKWNNPYLSLSGGIDSNTTFAAANGVYDKLKVFTYISAEKETVDAKAAVKIADRFGVEKEVFEIPETSDNLKDYKEIVSIIEHNNSYAIQRKDNEYRKRVFLIHKLEELGCDAEIKSWTSETIRAYWYKHYGRKTMPKLSAKLYRNLYKIFLQNRRLAHKVDKLFAKYIKEFEYEKVPAQYPPADLHYNEVTWGAWGGPNISEMKMYADEVIIYNNRKFLDLLFQVPLDHRRSDQHHLDMKRYLNQELYDMNIRVVNMEETWKRAFLLNCIFTANMMLP